MDKVVEYLEYITDKKVTGPNIKDLHKKGNKFEDSIDDPWFVKFINVDKKLLEDLIDAAEKMNIDSLLKLSLAKTMCLYIKDKSLEEMRQGFGVTDHGWTEEEYAKIEQELKWAKDNAF